MNVQTSEGTVLEVNNLRNTYGRLKALKGVTFSVARGDVFWYLGPNGSGKTTTLRIILGLVHHGRERLLLRNPSKTFRASDLFKLGTAYFLLQSAWFGIALAGSTSSESRLKTDSTFSREGGRVAVLVIIVALLLYVTNVVGNCCRPLVTCCRIRFTRTIHRT